jgi:molybdate transport system substrate-binding protein
MQKNCSSNHADFKARAKAQSSRRVLFSLRPLRLCVGVFFCGGALFAAEPLRIFAAAGTAPAMKEIAAGFSKETGIPVVFNFANAGVLARQINAGAPFDLFFSANEKWMDAVGSLIEESSRVDLLSDRLVLIVPAECRILNREPQSEEVKPLQISEFFIRYSAVPNGRFATGDQSTPLGIYARQAFEQLGWWGPLQGHLCAGDTVNKVLNYVALGEADAGVVFRSVASCAADRVDIVAAIPAELHSPIRFPIAAAADARYEALQFLEAVQQESAQCIFRKYGWSL